MSNSFFDLSDGIVRQEASHKTNEIMVGWAIFDQAVREEAAACLSGTVSETIAELRADEIARLAWGRAKELLEQRLPKSSK